MWSGKEKKQNKEQKKEQQQQEQEKISVTGVHTIEDCVAMQSPNCYSPVLCIFGVDGYFSM